MLAGFNLVYDGSGGGCSVYLDEVDEPLDRCRCLAVDEPAGKAVRVPGGGGPVECDVDYSRGSSDGPGHNVAVGRVAVDLDGRGPGGSLVYGGAEVDVVIRGIYPEGVEVPSGICCHIRE